MKLLAIINKDSAKLGHALNGLAHITLGLGSRLHGAPDIDVSVGVSAQVRAFRGDTDQQLRLGEQTPEADLTYLTCCFIGERIPEDLLVLMDQCSRLKDYVPYSSHEEAQLQQPQSRDEDSRVYSNIKISMLINGNLASVLNQMLLASLALGQKVDYARLRLLDVRDADGNVHPYISYHPYTIVKANPAGAMGGMVAAIESSDGVVFFTKKDAQDKAVVSIVFGPREAVEAVVRRDYTRLFNDELGKKSLVSVVPPVPPVKRSMHPIYVEAGATSTSVDESSRQATPALKK